MCVCRCECVVVYLAIISLYLFSTFLLFSITPYMKIIRLIKGKKSIEKAFTTTY